MVVRSRGARDRNAPNSGQAGQEMARTSTDADGRFRVAVAPGDYELDTTAGNQQCTPLDVTVPPGGYAEVTIMCDTGIR